MNIRIANPSDGADIAKIYAPVVKDTFISFEDIPPTSDDMSTRVEETLKTHPWLVMEENGHVIAYAYASPHRSRSAYKWSCDVSFMSAKMRDEPALPASYTNTFFRHLLGRVTQMLLQALRYLTKLALAFMNVLASRKLAFIQTWVSKMVHGGTLVGGAVHFKRLMTAHHSRSPF